MDGHLDPRLMKALSHPLRVEILRRIEDLGTASPVQLARDLEESLGVVSYHVRRLEALGFVELARRTPRRGAIEHHYRAPRATEGRPGAHELVGVMLEQRRREREVSDLLALLSRPGTPALFERREAHIELRVSLLDADGRAEVLRALRELEQKAGAIAAESAERMRRSHSEPQAAAIVLSLFESDLQAVPGAPTSDRLRRRVSRKL